MHRLAVAEAVARLTSADLARMRAANERFAAAVDAHDTDAALAADDDFHAVAVDASANRAVATVLDQFGPVVRRLERLRFASLAAADSVDLHDRLVAACEAGDADAAADVAFRTWQNLADLIPDPDPHPPAGDPVILEQFERYPLTFGPSPVQHLKRLTQHLAPGWRGRGVGQARGRQQRPGLRRQQGPQAGVHRPRRPRQRRRHARLHRRLPVQPHPAGRGGRRAPRPEVPPRAGEVGAVGRPDQHPGRQHPAQPDDGRRLAPRPGTASTSASATRGRTRSARSRRPAARRTPSRPAPASTASAASASPTGPSRSPSRRSRSASPSTRSSCAPSPARRTPG